MVNGNVRTVSFIGRQSAEDLYWCEETGEIYIRQPCDDQHVRWLTASKWTGGYEADCPMKSGLKMVIADKNGRTLYEELLKQEPYYMGSVAEKKAPFSYEAIKDLGKGIADNLKLISYEDWKAWLMASAEEHGYTGYYDNWLYAEVSREPMEKLDKKSCLGKTVWLTRQKITHKICGKIWTCFELWDENLEQCEEICGYVLNSNA